MARLYVKSAEIEKSGKTYLRGAWKDNGYDDGNVWRLEFEYHKKKLDRFMAGREIKNLNEDVLKSLWGYGMDSLQYMDSAASHNNLYKKQMHPVWEELNNALFSEYNLLPEEVKKANLEYRRKMARRWVLSFYAVKVDSYHEIPWDVCQEFFIDEESFVKAKSQVS